MNAFTTVAASWQSFYLLLGTAAATLIGLMFVAITFGSTLVKVENVAASRAFLDPTLAHFVQVLLTACFVVIPSMTPLWLGVLLIALAAVRLATLVRVFGHIREADRKNGDIELSDWMTGIVLPLASHLALAGTGVAFIAGASPFGVLAIVTIAMLLNGIYGAWELMVWLALTRAQQK